MASRSVSRKRLFRAMARWTYQMLGNENLWTTAEQVHALLIEGQIQHAIVGGLAVCLHGYRRNTVDLDVLIRPEDTGGARSALELHGYRWSRANKEFRSSSGVPVHWVLAGESQGPGQQARFPDPGDPKYVTEIEGLPVLTLAQLIQSKIASGLGDLRRTHKDFADVVELIAVRQLDGSFARRLHQSVRKEFRVLVRRARGKS